MVTFVCKWCDATLKKKQAENHVMGRCRPASLICIDCHVTFTGNDYKLHTNCLTEFEKHWGEFAKPKQKSQPIQAIKPAEENKDIEKKGHEKVHTQLEKSLAESKNSWGGWKNELKKMIRDNKNHIEIEQLRANILKRYKQLHPEEEWQQSDLQGIFEEKLCKIKKVKKVTYIELL